MTADFVNKAIALGTIVGLLGFVFGLFFLFQKGKVVSSDLAKKSLLASFLLSLIATLGSLYYSEIVHFPPCKFCWLQRIFLFPQVVLLGIAYYKKDFGIAVYSLALSTIGAVLALNHSFLQQFNFSVLPCSASGGVSCEKVLVSEFGFVTIPVMSLTVFLLLILGMLYVRRYQKQESHSF